jgi:plasmid replication initiation protein
MNKDSHRIVKSNLLIESRYRFSLIETKMFLLLIKDIPINDRIFTERKLYIRDLIEDAHIGSRAIYSRIKEISMKFSVLYIDLKKSEDAFDHRPIMSRFDYEKGREYILYQFNERLRKHLLRLKDNFTSYDIENIINCNSVYSIRIYELLKSFEYKKKKKKTFELSELKKMFDCEDAYKKWSDFRRFVLETAKKELKKHSDIYFDFSGIKKGRSIKLVEFRILKQKQQRLFDNKLEPAKPLTDYQLDATDKAETETARLQDPEVVSYSEIKDLKKANVTCNKGV